MDLIISKIFLFTGFLYDPQGNAATSLGVLHRISKKIDQDFLYTQLITVNIHILDLPDINGKFLLLRQSLIPDDDICFPYDIRDAPDTFIQLCLPALNPADLQYFIYDPQKMISRYLYL